MTAIAAELLVTQIMPIIMGAIARGAVRTVGSEDLEELQQDALASAASMLDSAERDNKPVAANSIAYYALQRTRSGRRSTSANRTDVMSPGAILDGNSVVNSLDEAVGGDPDHDNDEMTLHDVLGGSDDAPDTVAARELDWGSLMKTLPEKHGMVVQRTAEGFGPNEIAAELGVCAPRVVQLKRKVGRRIREVWGSDALADVARKPAWKRSTGVGR